MNYSAKKFIANIDTQNFSMEIKTTVDQNISDDNNLSIITNSSIMSAIDKTTNAKFLVSSVDDVSLCNPNSIIIPEEFDSTEIFANELSLPVEKDFILYDTEDNQYVCVHIDAGFNKSIFEEIMNYEI